MNDLELLEVAIRVAASLGLIAPKGTEHHSTLRLPIIVQGFMLTCVTPPTQTPCCKERWSQNCHEIDPTTVNGSSGKTRVLLWEVSK
jgi:hypothetical protein